MKNKKVARQKRARRGRAKIKELLIPRLCVFRSSKHIYAQIISGDGNAVSVTLLSSDMGKLYVVLAQALERLRQ